MSLLAVAGFTGCGSMEDALRVFNQMPSCNVVIWNAMVIRTCKMWEFAEGTRTVKANATARCAAKLYYICVVAECMNYRSCT
jgi:pentatricopeptide repeat protein